MTSQVQGWTTILVPLLLLVPLAVVHVLVHRLRGRGSIVGSFLIAFPAVALAFLAVRSYAMVRAGVTLDGVASLVVDLVTFAGLSYAYCDFLAYGEASVRTRILDEIRRGGDAGLSEADVLRRYNVRVIMDLRFERLAESGQIRIEGDRVFLGPNRFVQYLLAQVYQVMRRVLYGPDRSHPRTNAQSENQGQVPQ